MTREKAKEGIRLVELIDKIKNSDPYMVCFHVLEHNAPYLFGHQEFKIYESTKSARRVDRRDGYPLDMAADKELIQDEYTRFIERVKKHLDSKIAKLEKELAELKAE